MHRRSWCTALIGFVAALAFAATVARAQELADAGSPSAAPSDSSSAPTDTEKAQLEARRKLLFQQMLADPTNLDVAFEFAGISARVGDVEAAIATLERMLIFAPGLPRLQLELGVLYFRAGAYETARSYFDNALKAPSVPDIVKARVGPYLAEIDNRTKGYTVHGTLQSGYRYQTNANSGPNDRTILLGGLPFTLDDTAAGIPDYNKFVTASVNLSIDLQNQGDRFNVNFLGYGAWYEQRNDIDTVLAELKAGPLIDLARFGMKNSAFGVYGVGSGLLLGGDPYLEAIGGGTTFSTLLTPRTRLSVQDEYRREEYLNSDRRPTASLRSGHRVFGNARLQQQIGDRFQIFAAFQGERRFTEVDYFDVWEWGVSTGWVLAFNGPNAKQPDPWTVGLSGGYLKRDYDGPDPTVDSNPEWDKEHYLVGTFTMPLFDGWGVQAQGGFREVDSNYPLRNFQNIHSSVAVQKRF